MKIQYPAKITFDSNDGRFFVQLLDLEEAITEGENLEEALFNASEVLTLTLESRMDEGSDIPAPCSARQEKDIYFISPSARIQAALLIKLAKGKHTTAELARALSTSWPAVARLEDPHHWPSLKQLERIAGVLGQRLVISLEPTNNKVGLVS